MNKRRELLMAEIPLGNIRAFKRIGKMNAPLFLDIGGDAPDPNPGMLASAQSSVEVAQLQKQTADDYLNFMKEQYAELKPLAEQISKAMVANQTQQAEITRENRERANEYADYERTTYRPLEQALVKDAQEYDTEGKREQIASRAMADVATAYQNQRQQALDQMAKFGINPNSNRFAAINASLSRAEALDSAGAANNSRLQAEQLGYARKLDAASLGRNLASNATAAYGTAINAGNASVASGSSALSTAAAPGSAMGGAYATRSNILGGATGAYGTAGNIYGQEFNARMSGYQANQQAVGAVYGGIGNIAGRYAGSPGGSAAITALFAADGGKVHRGKGAVRGPGGPVDDKVPAMLSNGEYVLPADTTAAIGKDKLDKLVAQTHTPAAVQRRRSALQGRA